MPLADLYRGSCQPSDLGPDRGSLRNLYQQFGECESRSSERSRSRGNSSDGTQEPDDTNLWPFVNWAPVFFNACGMPAEQYAHALSQPLVVGTACTGSAAPSFALDQIVGAHNFSEVIASESHATTRKWLLENRNMHHLYHDLAFARTGGQCQVHHQHCPPMPLPSDKEGEGQARLDIYISGFVCKNFSQENNVRFQHSDVRELFISANIETDQSDVVGGKTRESFDKAKADLGMDTSSYEEYRAFTLLCKQRDSTWPRGLNGREIEQLDIIYHLLPIAERSRVVTDVVKSLGRRAWRSDGLSPTFL
ncbi:unnamed protein product [Durusdinium trenchii]|uniref:Uncharacterized protein n=1 Tax=Durusdinium trenchii TaxID=1381693 RepID=A0ABP0I9S3_9DINO